MSKKTKTPVCGGAHPIQDSRYCTDCDTAKEAAKSQFVSSTIERIQDYASKNEIACAIDGGSAISESAYMTVGGTKFRISTHKDFHGNPMNYVGVGKRGVLAFGRHRFATVEEVIDWLQN